MLNKFREASETVKKVYRNRYIAQFEEPEVKEPFKERKLALYFLVVSAVVLLLKFSGHREVDGEYYRLLNFPTFLLVSRRTCATYFS